MFYESSLFCSGWLKNISIWAMGFNIACDPLSIQCFGCSKGDGGNDGEWWKDEAEGRDNEVLEREVCRVFTLVSVYILRSFHKPRSPIWLNKFQSRYFNHLRVLRNVYNCVRSSVQLKCLKLSFIPRLQVDWGDGKSGLERMKCYHDCVSTGSVPSLVYFTNQIGLFSP